MKSTVLSRIVDGVEAEVETLHTSHLKGVQVIKHVVSRSGLEVVLVDELEYFLDIFTVAADLDDFFVGFGQFRIDD